MSQCENCGWSHRKWRSGCHRITLNCAVCQAPFHGWQNQTRRTCQNCTGLIPRARSGRTMFTRCCDYCSKEFTTANKRQRFCDRGCAASSLVVRKTDICRNCGLIFEYRRNQRPTIYCSRACSFEYQKKHSTSKAPEWRAKSTGGSYRKRAAYHQVPYEPINRLALFEDYGWRCAGCRQSTPRECVGTTESNAPELDHIIPMTKGGGHVRTNVQLLCRRCNCRKSNHRLHLV